MRNKNTILRLMFKNKKKFLALLCCVVFERAYSQTDSLLIVNNKLAASNELSKDTLFTNLDLHESKNLNEGSVYAKQLLEITKDVPLTYNEHVKGYIDSYLGNESRRGLISRMLASSNYYFPIFEKSLVDQGVPEEVKYLSIVESALNPNAVSCVGATGQWQFMFATAKVYDLEINSFVDERKDPVLASRAAAVYFKDAYDEFGDWLLAIAAYNCGKGNVKKAIDKAKSMDFWEIRPYLPKETRDYVPAYIGVVYAMNYYEQYGIEIAEIMDSPTDILYMDKPISLASLSKAMNMPLEKLMELNPVFKKEVVNGTPQKPCRIVIPVPTREQYANVYEVLENNADAIKAASVIAKSGEFSEKKKTKFINYKVKKGDSLSEIAEAFDGVTVTDIKNINGLHKAKLKTGMLLKIPRA